MRREEFQGILPLFRQIRTYLFCLTKRSVKLFQLETTVESLVCLKIFTSNAITIEMFIGLEFSNWFIDVHAMRIRIIYAFFMVKYHTVFHIN